MTISNEQVLSQIGVSLQRTAAETAAGVSPVSLIYQEGDIRRYGALTSATDNSTAINNALLVCAAGGAVFIPVGSWAFTSTLHVNGSASIYGLGQASVLNPNGCDGLTFGPQAAYAGSRFVRDIFLSGTAASANNGISVNFTAASSNKVYGVEFRNVSIENFGTGVFLRGLWDSSFYSCWLYNNYQGFNWNGQSIGCSVIGGFCQKGIISGAGTQYAMQINSLAGEQCQALYLSDWDCFGYDYGISGGPMLDVIIYGSSFNNCGIAGINLSSSSGGFVVRDCWIQTNNSGVATIGINLNDLGSPVNDKIILEGNEIVCNLANAGSIGIYIGSNQLGVSANNNTVGANTTQFSTGISIKGSNAISKFNTINASTTAVLVNSSATDVVIGPNYVIAGTLVAFSSTTPLRFSYSGGGTFPLTLTGMTGTVTGTVTWSANGRVVQLSVPVAGILGTSNATTMTGTGLPSYLWPNANREFVVAAVDSGTANLGNAQVASATGVITFFKDIAGDPFTNTGSKGLSGLDSSYAY